MKLEGKSKLQKLQKKNKGNNLLVKAIDQFINDVSLSENIFSLLKKRKNDVDRIYYDNIYWFNLNMHRTVGLLVTSEDNEEEDRVEILWVGNHDEYERTFGNNRDTAEKWLRYKQLID